MYVRAARDRAEMWQIGPRISSVTGCYPYSSTGLRGGTVYFHDVPTVDTIALPDVVWPAAAAAAAAGRAAAPRAKLGHNVRQQLPCKVNGQSCGLNFML